MSLNHKKADQINVHQCITLEEVSPKGSMTGTASAGTKSRCSVRTLRRELYTSLLSEQVTRSNLRGHPKSGAVTQTLGPETSACDRFTFSYCSFFELPTYWDFSPGSLLSPFFSTLLSYPPFDILFFCCCCSFSAGSFPALKNFFIIYFFRSKPGCLRIAPEGVLFFSVHCLLSLSSFKIKSIQFGRSTFSK